MLCIFQLIGLYGYLICPILIICLLFLLTVLIANQEYSLELAYKKAEIMMYVHIDMFIEYHSTSISIHKIFYISKIICNLCVYYEVLSLV